MIIEITGFTSDEDKVKELIIDSDWIYLKKREVREHVRDENVSGGLRYVNHMEYILYSKLKDHHDSFYFITEREYKRIKRLLMSMNAPIELPPKKEPVGSNMDGLEV